MGLDKSRNLLPAIANQLIRIHNTKQKLSQWRIQQKYKKKTPKCIFRGEDDSEKVKVDPWLLHTLYICSTGSLIYSSIYRFF
jgi:hypothetical protein